MCIVFFCVNGYEKICVNNFRCSNYSAMKLIDVSCVLQDNQCWELQSSSVDNLMGSEHKFSLYINSYP